MDISKECGFIFFCDHLSVAKFIYKPSRFVLTPPPFVDGVVGSLFVGGGTVLGGVVVNRRRDAGATCDDCC